MWGVALLEVFQKRLVVRIVGLRRLRGAGPGSGALSSGSSSTSNIMSRSISGSSSTSNIDSAAGLVSIGFSSETAGSVAGATSCAGTACAVFASVAKTTGGRWFRSPEYSYRTRNVSGPTVNSLFGGNGASRIRFPPT